MSRPVFSLARWAGVLILCAFCALPALGQTAEPSGLTALARTREGASITGSRTVEMVLPLSQGVPFRIFSQAGPDRITIEFSEVDWSGFAPEAMDQSEAIEAVRVGALRPGWSRMELLLSRPLRLESAAMSREGAAGSRLTLRLVPQSAEGFAAAAATSADTATLAPDAAPQVKQRQTGDRPLVVVLDPGHGGLDPGAERGETTEADLMLTFARELKEALLRAGNFDVVLTREEDVFVPLETRLTVARAVGADVFLSLHADAIAEGRASGATIYTLSETASDAASQKLAERHDRTDLLAGVDLEGHDDVVAGVLMDMARTETAPRSDRLADALVAELSATVGMHKRPRLEAGFSVLKAPDIPSVLIELGFMSSPRDLERLTDAAWRAKAAWALRDGLMKWAADDAAEARLLRK